MACLKHPYFKYFSGALVAGLLLFFVVAPVSNASPLSLDEQHQVASLSARLSILKKTLEAFASSLFRGGFAQVSTSTSTWSSCSSSLISLLGSGCHQMYTDSSGNPIYCNGEMTLSAKSGDTTTTSGCSSSTSSTSSSVTFNTVFDLSGSYVSSSNGVTITWTDNSIGEDEYKIWRRVNGGSWTFWSSRARPYNDGGILTYTDNAVSSGSTYEYMIKACTYSGSCASSDSNIASVAVPGSTGGTTGTLPSAPTGLAAGLSGSNVILSWSDNAFASGKTYTLERRITAGSWGTLATGISIPGGSGSYTDYSPPSGSYEYRVKACDSSGCSTESNTAYASVGSSTGGGGTATTTTPTTTTLNTVYDLSGSYSSSANNINITWIENSVGEDYYKIYRRSPNGSWTLWFTMSRPYNDGTSLTYSDAAGMTSGSIYEYKVTACTNAGSCSSDSNIASVTVGVLTSTTTTVATSTTTGATSCDSALTALLGTGCHQMYTDSSGNPIFCDGPMAKSAKRGDTAVTTGCQGSSTVPSGQKEQIWNSFGLRSWIRTDASQSRIDSLKQSCTNVPSGANVWLPYSGDSSSPDFGMPDSAKCSLAGACTTNQYFDGTKCVGSSTAQCSDGRDNDGDGFIDYPADSSCYGREDDDEFYPQSPVATTSPLYLNYLSPSYGSIGTVVTIYGSGFASSGNRINFDTGVITDISSPDGKTLKFSVPEDRVPLCAITDPRCLLPAPYNPVKAGTYRITVTSGQNTTASALFFTVSDAGKSCPAGFHVMSPDAYSSTDYCMADADSSSCQPLGGGAGYRCPSAPVVTGCDTTLIALLGAGCHYMFNDNVGNPIYCDGNMTKSAKKGDTAATPGCQQGGVGPNVPFGVDAASSYPRDREREISTLSRIRVKFTREIDLSSTISQFFQLAPLSDQSATLNGSFQFFGDSFEFTPSVPLKPGTAYLYKVFTTLKERGGTALPSQFSASFTTSGGATEDTAGVVVGSVSDADGKSLSGAFVQIYKSDYTSKFETVSAEDGTFSFTLSPGIYVVDVYPPSNKKDLLRPSPQKIVLTGGSKKSVFVQFAGSPKAIFGTVKFSGGGAVTDAEVGAYSLDSYQWRSAFTDSAGAFTLRLNGGKWKLGVRPRDSAGAKWSHNSVSTREVIFPKNDASEFQLIDFTVQLSDATLKVTAVDDSGKALADVGIVVDTAQAASRLEENFNSSAQFRITDSSGGAKFLLQSNRYYIRGFAASDRGYLNPPEQEVTPIGGKTVEQKIVFKKKTSANAVSIKGIVKLEDGVPTDAFVWAWSERGGYVSTVALGDGSFELKVGPNERWHLGAGKVVKNTPYKSSEIVVEIKDDSYITEVVLSKYGKESLPPPVVIKEIATKQMVAQADDGAKAVIPPQAAAASGNVSVEVKPTIEAPSQAGSRVVSTVYDVSIRDSAGTQVTKLNSDIEIIIPYDEAELTAKGIKEDDIIPSFFDEKTGAWVKIENFTIDKEKNIVISRVNHLTRFGLVASTDTTPPPAPTNISAVSAGEGKVKVSWQNSSESFAYAKVYRSDKAGELGRIVAPQVKDKQFMDETVADGIIYYYTVRAVDSAGNESNNKDQATIKAIGTAGQPKVLAKPMATGTTKSRLARTLGQGAKGDEVKTLQALLVKEGFLAPDSATGFFGKLTKEAVIRFQEKYASDILKPAGLTKGNGLAGPGTRKKMNELLGK